MPADWSPQLPAANASNVTSGKTTAADLATCGVTPTLDASGAQSCLWRVPAGRLLPGKYLFVLRVVASGGAGGNATAQLQVEVEDGLLATVTIARLRDRKQNPATKLPLVGQLALVSSGGEQLDPEDLAAATATVRYAWRTDDPSLDLNSPNVSSTGGQRLNLVILPQRLRAGASYTFELVATYQDFKAVARADIVMNRAPCTASRDHTLGRRSSRRWTAHTSLFALIPATAVSRAPCAQMVATCTCLGSSSQHTRSRPTLCSQHGSGATTILTTFRSHSPSRI
jgi:hypothetical protein